MKNNQKNTTKSSIEALREFFPEHLDVNERKMTLGGREACLFYIECLIDKKLLSQNIIAPILAQSDSVSINSLNNIVAIDKIEISPQNEAKTKVFEGCAVLAIDGEENYAVFAVQGYETRSIAEPPTSSVLKGPREGFVEDLNVNVSMLRRRLKTPNLAVLNLVLGRQTRTKVAVVYLTNIASKKVVKEVIQRLKNIDIDGVTASYYIETLLRNNESQLFRQLGNTEKPDIATAKILEGRVVIIVDGSPIVVTVPFVFLEDMQSSDDYYMHPARATFIRYIRFFGVLLAILLPGLYVALESYHYRILPIDFLITIRSSIEGISFPPLVEVLFVIFLFEILNEASIRMPKYLGMALSIIGALTLGETAVQAGIITPPSIMIVAISGITIYILPDEAPITSLLRVVFTFAGGFAGFFGIIIGIVFMTAYLVSIQNFSTPLMAPFAPHIAEDQKDALVKSGITKMITRPKSLPNTNKIRQVPHTILQAREIEQKDPDLNGKLVARVKEKNAQAKKRAQNLHGESVKGGNND